MTEYEAGKDVAILQRDMQAVQQLIEQIYMIIEHNVKAGRLKEPPKKG